MAQTTIKRGRKVQKKIKYWKTPLEPKLNNDQTLWEIKFAEKNGNIPGVLRGQFTSKEKAQTEIDRFLAKHQVEYIEDGENGNQS